MKSVRIRSYSGPHFPAFRLNNSEYGHFLRSETVIYYPKLETTEKQDEFENRLKS